MSENTAGHPSGNPVGNPGGSKTCEKPPGRSGFVAIVGRPNAGKSTLLNAILGTELSIVSPKAQTTRERVLGILTESTGQIVFIDTPGMHAGRDKLEGAALDEHLRRYRAGVVAARHHVAVGPGAHERQVLALADLLDLAVLGEAVRALADGSHDVGHESPPGGGAPRASRPRRGSSRRS